MSSTSDPSSTNPILPPEIWQRVSPIALSIAVFYVVQPLWMRFGLLSAAPLVRLAAFVGFAGLFAYLAVALRHALTPEYYSFDVNLLWWLYALLMVKNAHAALAPDNLKRVVNLYVDNDTDNKKKDDDNDAVAKQGPLSWTKLCILCYCPPTVVFRDNTLSTSTRNDPTAFQPHPRSVSFYVTRGVAQLVIMGQVSELILRYELDETLPLFIQHWYSFYAICLSQGGFSDLFMSAPTRGLLTALYGPKYGQIYEASDMPAVSTNPRRFWHRWSQCVGFSLRQCVYEPCGGYERQYWATFCTFGTNYLLHLLFWGPVSTPRQHVEWKYLYVLGIAPALALALDHGLWKPLGSRVRWVGNFVTLQVLAAWLMPHFLEAQGMPLGLRDLALLQTGRL